MERPDTVGVSSALCICCLGSISDAVLDALSAEIEKAVRGRTRGYAGCPTCISVITPPILDTGIGIFTCYLMIVYYHPSVILLGVVYRIQSSITSLLLLAYVSMPTYCIRSVRITARTAITRSSEKRFPFPCVNEYVHRQLLRRLKGDIVFVPDSDAKLKVMIDSVVSLYLSYLYSSAPQ